MPKVSKRLRVSNEKHPTLGEVIQLYSPADPDGTSAFFLDTNDGDVIKNEPQFTGMGLRLTYKTAQKLGKILLDITKPKRRGNA